VEEDVGRDIAMKVAAQLVMFFKRPGGQMQFSREGESLPAGRSALQEVQRFIAANPSTDHSVTRLAARSGLRPRHFARLFRSEVGVTPAAWVEAARVAAARACWRTDGTRPSRSPCDAASPMLTRCAAPSSAMSASRRRNTASATSRPSSRSPFKAFSGIVNFSRSGILLPSVAGGSVQRSPRHAYRAAPS
jgi:AraC-like DNA-binding protein